MKFIKGYFAINFLALVFVGIVQYIKTFQLENLVSSAFCLFISILLFRSLSKKKTTKNSDKKCSNSLEKKDDLLESTITQLTENEPPESYIETENVIYRADEKPIFDKEVPYLIQIGQEKATAKWKIPELQRQIKESYQLMCTTNNPETLCSRYKLIVEKIKELAYFEQKGLFDKDSFAQYNALITEDNYCNLILACYTKYVDKARSKLTTEKGINNRIDKFLKIIHQNVNDDIYNRIFSAKS